MEDTILWSRIGSTPRSRGRAEVLGVATVREFRPFEPKEHAMVCEELDARGKWLGMPVVEGDARRDA